MSVTPRFGYDKIAEVVGNPGAPAATVAAEAGQVMERRECMLGVCCAEGCIGVLLPAVSLCTSACTLGPHLKMHIY
ncbi:hypothetical protein G7K_1057-t1 [Saitoella complicata NRRL Y-17804]|uniref:Uncharacterized protein n=1 Tax=Saitoella complicata (strain BCRC 22490 / CBS 7301 / JCM 7358 / NBRC 10748 / NRRL Y-17804) TaxID=698492 RepID=A0A0E9NAH1_SAICN|nr:hypothetical protein G7K_1057-t1 [Saitoella complicata NRRL Y-17804]